MKVRARIIEEVEEEKPSNYLIGRQSNTKSNNLMNKIRIKADIMENLNAGVSMQGREGIECYVNQYYQKMICKRES